jgi:hypothetical protein
MKRYLLLALILAFIFPAMAHARTEKVRAVEGDISTPYATLGTLEVKTKVGGRAIISGRTVQVLTLGILNPTSAKYYRKKLKAKLAKKAAKHYGANAVINVHYWPDPNSRKFPQGFIYARGEMVRYIHFPSKS